MKKRTYHILLADLIIVGLSLLCCLLYKGKLREFYLIQHSRSIIIFFSVWIALSFYNGKYNIKSYHRQSELLRSIVLSNFVITGTISIIIFITRFTELSRFIVYGTIVAATVLELIPAFFYYFIYISTEIPSPAPEKKEPETLSEQEEKMEYIPEIKIEKNYTVPSTIGEYIKYEYGKELHAMLTDYIDLDDPCNLLLSTTTKFNIEKQTAQDFKSIVNLRRINDIRYINKFFETVNERLPKNGLFIGCVETKNLRKKRILRKFPIPFNYLYYYFIDFPFKRLMPKFAFTKKAYFFLTRGQNRVITRAETLGRLYSCGFEVVDERFIGNLFYFIVKKIGIPSFDLNPTYGPFIKLRRIGKHGKIINVYKFRTMHPYAEYLQDYVYKMHNLQDGGKFKNDFRVSTLGKILRKFWLDELPMIINFLKLEIKLVGVRPLSKHYFSLYTKELQEKRIKVKPGLIPPFYVDMPKTFEEIMDSEMRYLDAYLKHPFRTDVKYFFKAIINIVFKKARSK